jgi:serine phosphatase RsbU (regulator of sigma subunit)
LKGDRFAVGLASQNQTFTRHVVELQDDDVIYLFSDGYVDQFGGPQGKKFKTRRFRHILLNIHRLPISSQKDILKQSFDNWKGDLEQVDDILVIGLKPLK